MVNDDLGPVLTKTMTRIDALQAENAELRAQLAREQTALDAWMQKTNALQRRISALQQPAPPAQPDAAALVSAYEQLERAARLIAELPTPKARFWGDGMTRIDKALEAIDAARAAAGGGS